MADIVEQVIVPHKPGAYEAQPKKHTMESDEPVSPLSQENIPRLTDITSLQALAYVGQLLEQLIILHEVHWGSGDATRRPSFESAEHSGSSPDNDPEKSISFDDMPGPEFRAKVAAAQQKIPKKRTDNDLAMVFDPDLFPKIPRVDSALRKFWLKQAPNIAIDAYLKRFHRYCPSSAASYLTAGSLLYLVAVEMRFLPVSRRNVYRLFSAAFIVSAKLVEDKLYSMNRYATTAGLQKPDLARLELTFLLLVDFNVSADSELLTSRIQNWALLNDKMPELKSFAAAAH